MKIKNLVSGSDPCTTADWPLVGHEVKIFDLKLQYLELTKILGTVQ